MDVSSTTTFGKAGFSKQEFDLAGQAGGVNLKTDTMLDSSDSINANASMSGAVDRLDISAQGSFTPQGSIRGNLMISTRFKGIQLTEI